jgi:uncharacterized protein (DUF2344 family)
MKWVATKHMHNQNVHEENKSLHERNIVILQKLNPKSKKKKKKLLYVWVLLAKKLKSIKFRNVNRRQEKVEYNIDKIATDIEILRRAVHCSHPAHYFA